MGKRKPNQEAFDDDGRELIFSADMGMLEALADKGRDPAEVYAALAAGLMPPVDVRNVLEASGPEGLDAADLINRHGLQECSIVARLMLSHAMIGDIKKSQALGLTETRANILAKIGPALPSRWENLKRLGLLWVSASLTSAALVCGIFKYSGLIF